MTDVSNDSSVATSDLQETGEALAQPKGPTGKWLADLFAWAAALLCAVASWQARDNYLLGGLLVGAAAAIVLSQWLDTRAWRRATRPSRTSNRGKQSLEGEEAIREKLVEAAKHLERRERRLADRLNVFHQWLEFPEPIQLDETQKLLPADTEVDLHESRAFYEKDRQLLQLIEAETEQLFNRILANQYMVDGKFDAEQARDHALALVHKVSRIYQPGVEEPLLETSMALVLRSASRASLQLLVVLEQLPIDIKDLTVQRLYRYVRKAVQAYGVYKSARPYFPWVTNAMYVGRYAFGANPLSLGAWYATGTLGQRLAKATTERLVNQQALQLIHGVVQLTAFEVAQAYSGDFRKRDPNWIYAAELTNLVSRLPASARTLSLAMAEIGSLHLRSEYDRVWFYRCLAAGKPGGINQTACAAESRDRLSIANRLERFVTSLPEGLGEAIASWRSEVEPRLNIKLGAGAYQGGESAVRQALQSLGGFLLETKKVDDDRWLALLAETETAKLKPQLLDELKEQPPFLFNYPEISPGSDVAKTYVADLIHLAAELPDRGPAVVMALEEVTAYMRIESDAMRGMWHAALMQKLQATLGEQRLRGAPPETAVAMALDLMTNMERVDAVFWPAKLHVDSAEDQLGPDQHGPPDDPIPLLMIAGDGRVTAWCPGDLVPVWDAGAKQVRAERQRSVIGSYCHLHTDGQPVLVLEGAAWTRYQRYFDPLMKALA